MRIGFAGLAHSHAFSDARSARLSGNMEIGVWEDDLSRRSKFVREYEALSFDSLKSLTVWEPDLVIVTVHPALIPATVRAILDVHLPCFLNKVPASSFAALDALSAAVDGRSDFFFTSSVLRFAPELQRLKTAVEEEEILSLDLEIQHDISGFLKPETRWQDDPAIGGGTAISMGLHAWEMATVILGPRVTPGGGATSARVKDTLSEDLAVLSGVSDLGAVISVRISGIGEEESYRATVRTTRGNLSASLKGRDPFKDLGYLGCFSAATAMAQGAPPPVQWSESQRIILNTLRAAESARSQPKPTLAGNH